MTAENKLSTDFIGVQNDGDIETLITAIYHKCRMQMSNDDPCLATYYIMCFMAGRLEASLRQVAEEHNRNMQDQIGQINADAAKKAESIVNGAIKASESIVRNAIKDSASAVRDESKRALEDIKAAHAGVEGMISEQVAKIRFANEGTGKTMKTALILSIVAAVAGIASLAVSIIR